MLDISIAAIKAQKDGYVSDLGVNIPTRAIDSNNKNTGTPKTAGANESYHFLATSPVILAHAKFLFTTPLNRRKFIHQIRIVGQSFGESRQQIEEWLQIGFKGLAEFDKFIFLTAKESDEVLGALTSSVASLIQYVHLRAALEKPGTVGGESLRIALDNKLTPAKFENPFFLV